MARRQASLFAKDLDLLEPFWKEPVERFHLPNGLTVILKPDRSAALASVQVWVRTGSQHEGEHLGAGLSHYLEHMMFKGTAKRSGREISATIQGHGGDINAYTSFDRTVYYADLPARHLEVALDVLADAIFASTLPADEVTRERDVILREIDMTRDDPENRFWEALFASGFREHPYRHPIIGHREAFSAVTREDLLRYYRSRYVPNNTVLVIVGDIDAATLREQIGRHFGTVPRRPLAPVYIPDEPAPLARREQHVYEDVELTRGALSWHIPGLGHPDAPALDLLGTVLGGGDSSVLWQAVREKSRLVHSIDAQAWNPGNGGLFCISFTCEPEKRAAAVAAIEKVLRSHERRGFKPAQLGKARRQLIVSEINTRRTMSGQASRLGAAEVVVGDLEYGRTYFERLAALRPADLARIVRTYLQPARAMALSQNPKRVAAAAAVESRAARTLPDFEQIRLENGARLVLQPDSRLPNLHLRLLCLGGPKDEDPSRRGASALLATMLTKDTRKRSAAEVAHCIEEVGGVFRGFAGNNSLGLAAEVLPPDAGRALELIGDAILRPAFRRTTFEKERAAQLAELRQDADDVVTFARKRIRQLYFDGHPLAIDAHGDEAGVRALVPDELSDLHRRLWSAPNVVFAVAGDFQPRSLVPKLKAFLSRLPKGAGQKGAGRSWNPPAGRNLVERRQREQAVIFQAHPAPRLMDRDFYVGEVADELFSGMASRLFERVREEKGLAYFVRSCRVTGLDASMFQFYAGTAPAHAEEVLKEIDLEIARVREGGVEDAEIERCRARLQAARQQGMQTNGARAFQAGLAVLFGLPVNDWKKYDARVEAVTREDLARFASKYLGAENRIRLTVTP
jgi:zinc protease